MISTPAAHERFVDARLEMPSLWGDVLFNEWIEGAQRCVSHFVPFLKLDVFYISATDAQPSPWLRFPVQAQQGSLAGRLPRVRWKRLRPVTKCSWPILPSDVLGAKWPGCYCPEK